MMMIAISNHRFSSLRLLINGMLLPPSINEKDWKRPPIRGLEESSIVQYFTI